MQKQLNFTVDAYLRRDGEWGSFDDSTGKWNGMVSSLIKKEVDLVADELSISVERSKVICYLMPIVSMYDTVLINNNLHIFSWSTFVNPFDDSLWTFILFHSVLLTIINIIFHKIKLNNCDVKKHPTEILKLTTSIFFTTFGIKVPENVNYDRILIFSVCLVGNTLFIGYQAELTSELAVKHLNLPFTNMDELVESDYTLYVPNTGMHQVRSKICCFNKILVFYFLCFSPFNLGINVRTSSKSWGIASGPLQEF